MTIRKITKRGTITIPKSVRTACELHDGALIDLRIVNGALVITPLLQERTEMDDHFDKMRQILIDRGVTLNNALETLREHRARRL